MAIGCMTARDKSLFKWFPLLIFVFDGLFFYIIPFIWGSIVAPAVVPVAELSELAAQNGVELQAEADRVVQTIITQNLPQWFGVYVLLGVIAAAVSTAAVSFLSQGAMALYLTDVSVPGFAQWAPALVGGLLWKRATRQGAIAGTLAGVIYLVASLLIVVGGERILVVGHPVIPGLLVNTIVFVVVSKLTPHPSEQIETQFFTEVDEYLKAEAR